MNSLSLASDRSIIGFRSGEAYAHPDCPSHKFFICGREGDELTVLLEIDGRAIATYEVVARRPIDEGTGDRSKVERFTPYFCSSVPCAFVEASHVAPLFDFV